MNLYYAKDNLCKAIDNGIEKFNIRITNSTFSDIKLNSIANIDE